MNCRLFEYELWRFDFLRVKFDWLEAKRCVFCAGLIDGRIKFLTFLEFLISDLEWQDAPLIILYKKPFFNIF